MNYGKVAVHAAAAAILLFVSLPKFVAAQTLTAQESDPREMGWMKGAPPPPDKLITQPDSNYFSFPKLRWSVCHLREFLPTEEISRGLGAPVPLDYLPLAAFDAEPPWWCSRLKLYLRPQPLRGVCG